ncbi:MAG: 16S rRNA (cytidine(1402)-2'-O)-methyltransferase [Acidimicrobiia bacterium]
MSERGRLVVCATPIGNLNDVSDRLRDVLGSVDIVFAEDTRRTAKLLQHIGASPRVRSLFVGNEHARTEEVLAALEGGETVALVSDAGMPTVSDPGAGVVRAASSAGHHVSVIPGPSAVTSAVAVAGFGADRFSFEGFLPRKGKERSRRLDSIAGEDRPVVLFASPHRLAGDLGDLAAVVRADRELAVIRELTKLHEEIWVGPISEAVEVWSDREIRGEITVVLAAGVVEDISPEAAIEEARSLVAGGSSPSEAARRVASATGVPRRVVYQALIKDQV